MWYVRTPCMIACMVLSVVCLSRRVAAQTYWLQPVKEKGISLQAFKNALTIEGRAIDYIEKSTWFLSGKFPVSDKVSVFAELPFSHYDQKGGGYYYNYYDEFEAQNLIGNPYIGVEYAQSGSGVIAAGGVRFPVAEEDKGAASAYGFINSLGLFGLDIFAPHIFTLYAATGYRYIAPQYHSFRFLVGPAVLISTEKESDSELFADYNAEYRVRADIVTFGAGFSGRVLLTQDELDFNERTWHQLGFLCNVAYGMFKPGIHLRVPLDKGWAVVYGFNLSVELP